MLRLWPERRSAAVFSDRAWLYMGKRLLDEIALPVGAGRAGPHDAVEALLQRHPVAAWKRSGLDLLLSDEMARIVALPWQDGLRTTVQQLRYAQACLEDVGVHDASWTVQYGYRRYGRAGIGFAMQTDTLRQLADLAARSQLLLRSVLPAAVAAYWRHRPAGGTDSLLILNETRRVSVLRFAGGSLEGVDLQPIVESAEVALRRLLRRVQLQSGAVGSISCWSAVEPQPTRAAVVDCFPNARLRLLPHGSLG